MVAAFAQLGDHRRRGRDLGRRPAARLVLVDDAGDPVRPAKLWNDTTSAPDAERLVAQLGAQRWAAATGSVPVAAFTISKLAWVARNEPEVLARATTVMLPHDYLTWRLTGEHVTDRGDASGTGWFDAATGDSLCDLFKLATDGTWDGAVPTVLGPTDAAGTITALPPTPSGCPPRWSSVRAAATTWAPRSASGCEPVTSRSRSARRARCSPCRPPPPATRAARWRGSRARAVRSSRWSARSTPRRSPTPSPAGSGPTRRASLRWRSPRSTIPARCRSCRTSTASAPPTCPTPPGTFQGLTNATTREQLALAAHDGVLCGLLAGVDALRDVGASVDGRIFLVGGGSRSAAYRQRAADLTGKPVTVVPTPTRPWPPVRPSRPPPSRVATHSMRAERWHLGAGVEITPRRPGLDRRRAGASRGRRPSPGRPRTRRPSRRRRA
jgi:xylulokinase